ncbi:MAG: CBS domain-containing protein [Gammaproteobacteria bacterium]
MIVKDMMTMDVVTCFPEDLLVDIASQIATNKFSCIVVIEDRKPVGIITERDLVKLLVKSLQGTTWDDQAIREFMTSPVITVDEDMPLEDVIVMKAHKNEIRHMPVIDIITGELVGILTQTDIIEASIRLMK